MSQKLIAILNNLPVINYSPTISFTKKKCQTYSVLGVNWTIFLSNNLSISVLLSCGLTVIKSAPLCWQIMWLHRSMSLSTQSAHPAPGHPPSNWPHYWLLRVLAPAIRTLLCSLQLEQVWRWIVGCYRPFTISTYQILLLPGITGKFVKQNLWLVNF